MTDNTTFTTTASPEKEAVSSEQHEEAQVKEEPIATLLGSISYSNDEDWQNFLDKMSVHHAIVVLIAGVNYAQAKGSYNLAEAELIAKAIKTLTKTLTKAQQANEEFTEDADSPEKN